MLKPMKSYGIGDTPLIELPEVAGNRIFLKMESHNHLGSVKARTAYGIICGLEIPRSLVIVESTSGNLGIALDFFCKEDGRPFLCLLDESVVQAKIKHIQDCGIAFEIVPKEEGLDGRTSRMKRAAALNSSGEHFWVDQYNNENGVNIHKNTTGPEIFSQTNGEVTAVFCAVGSGGTISGVGEYMHTCGRKLNVFGVEPKGSTIFHTVDKPYITAGAGLRGKPGNIRKHIGVISGAFEICDAESIANCKELIKLGFNVGITTGMAYSAATKYCGTKSGETVVVIAADGIEFYHDYL